MEDEMRRKSRRSLIIWVVVFLLVVGPVVAFVLYRMYLFAEIEARMQAIRDAGYPATLEDLAAWAPEVLYEENAALVYEDAFEAFPAKGNKAFIQLKKKVPVVSEVKLPAAGEALPDEMQENIAAYLKAHEETMGLLHRAGMMKRSRYPLNYLAGPGMLLPHLAQCRHSARLLKLEAVLAVEQGDTARAVKAVKSSLGITRSLRTEPLLISQLVRMAIRSITSGSLARALSRRQFKDAELRELEKAFRAELDKKMMVRAFVGERCCGSGIFRGFNEGMLGPTGNKQVPVNVLQITGLLDKDMLAYMDLMEGMVESSKLPWYEQREADMKLEMKLQQMSKLCLFTPMLVPALTRASTEGAKSTARIEIARAALAVERYRLKYGKLPGGLAEVAPEFIAAVPDDPFDGKPLRYKLAEKGYVVYSVGVNGKDDEGMEYEDGKRRGERLDEALRVGR